MNEATIAANLLDIIERRLNRYPRTNARSVTVLIGKIRNIKEEALRFAFDSLKKSASGCANCELFILTSKLVAVCAQNDHLYEPSARNFYRCTCGARMGRIVQGQELDVIGCTLAASS